MMRVCAIATLVGCLLGLGTMGCGDIKGLAESNVYCIDPIIDYRDNPPAWWPCGRDAP